MNIRFILLLGGFMFNLPAHAITAFQNIATFSFEEKESLSNSNQAKLFSASFEHHHQLVNPFGGPVDEAAFLNRIGSTGVSFNHINLDMDLGVGGSISPNGIGYLFEYNYRIPNKLLSASLQVGRQSIEDEIAGGVLLEGKVNSTRVSIGGYIDEYSQVDLTSDSQKIDFSSSGAAAAEIDMNSLRLRYKKVVVNPGRKSFNFEASYLRGDHQVMGSTVSSDFTVIGLLADVYFNAQTRVGFGISNNSDKSAAGNDSRTVILRGNKYFNSMTSVGFSYFNTSFDANINDEKSFEIFYRKLIR